MLIATPRLVKRLGHLNSVHKSRKAIDLVPQRLISGKMTAIWNVNETQIIIKTMQNALGIKMDGDWGQKTTTAVNAFRKVQGYKTARGQIGPDALKKFLF